MKVNFIEGIPFITLIHSISQLLKIENLSDLVYLFNGIQTPYGLFNAEILLICKCLMVKMTIFNVLK